MCGQGVHIDPKRDLTRKRAVFDLDLLIDASFAVPRSALAGYDHGPPPNLQIDALYLDARHVGARVGPRNEVAHRPEVDELPGLNIDLGVVSEPVDAAQLDLRGGARAVIGELGEIERLGLRWDGRTRIAAVDLQSGRRVMFGAPAAPAVSVADAVVASCAIPGVFRPMSSGGRSYVDGGVWSPTNMDTASASRGARVLCLNPTGSLRASARVPGAALGIVSRSIAAAEALALRRRGARVTVVNPDERSRAAMGADLLDPRPRAAVAAAGLQQGQRMGAGLAA